MSPKTKGKAKKAKGASASASLTKQMKKAPKHSQVPKTFVQGLGVTEGDEEGWMTEDEVSATTQGAMAQKMNSMMEMLMDLCHRVKDT